MDNSSYEAVPTYEGVFAQEKRPRISLAPASAISLTGAGYEGVPLAENDSRRSSAFAQKVDRRLLGWRAGVTGVTALVFACLVINISFLIWALASHRTTGGIAILQRGSCQTSANLNTGIHLVINLLSTGMLSGMQRLSAPTRHELDEAHMKYTWLDIGVPSFRKLLYINRWRTLGWTVLAVSSLPSHLFYNLAVFAQISATDYSVFIVDQSFANGAFFNVTVDVFNKAHGVYDFYEDRITASQSLKWLYDNIHALDKLSTADCINEYAQQMQTARGHVIAVASPFENTLNNSLLSYDTTHCLLPDSFAWLCNFDSSNITPCTAAQAHSAQPWKVQDYEISYCLSQPITKTCELQFSSLIPIIVIVCNLFKCVIMLFTLWRANEPQLVTMGDCIASCLQDSDDTTAGMCLLDKYKVTKGQWRSASIAQTWDIRRRRWFAAASSKRWIIGTSISAVGLIFTGVILGRGFQDPNFPENRTMKGLWSMEFGAVNMGALVSIGDYTDMTLLTSTLLCNTPQLILSVLYFSYNSVFTCELVSREWNDFGRRRKPLRVTRPSGGQKSTYWLNLPYQYGLPLMIVAILLHWLFSRAIFPVNIQTIDPITAAQGTSITQCGWSPSAVIVSIIAAGLVVIVGLLFGLRRYHAGPPLVGSCSAAIAAACHREPSEGADMVLSPLKWGVTSVQDGVGHCTFSAREVEMPDRRDVYR